jgi:sarcosine oxidase
MRTFDAIVVGVGAMGGAACYHLARRGLRVLGIEQFHIAHDRGSSHGQTRIIRKAYFEHPDYVPLLDSSYRLWCELEAESGQSLLERTGLLLIGAPDGELMRGVREATTRHHVRIEKLGIAEVRKQFSHFHTSDADGILLEPDAGFLRVEDCVRTQAELAVRTGAEIRQNEQVRQWRVTPAGVEVTTDRGCYSAGELVACGGAWAGRLLTDLRIPLTVLRKVQLWFRTCDPRYRRSAGSPVFAVEEADGFFYGFPAIDGDELKVAEHTGRDPVADPDSPDRSLNPGDTERVAAFVERRLPGVERRVMRHSVCMYTMSPDGHFIIDRHPVHANVLFAAGFSGHGFKFAPLVGSVLADLVCDGATAHPVGFLSLSRPALRT